jgi:guanylate kinase
LKGRKSLQERKSKGCLFIVSAPSGTGKTTLCKKLVLSMPNLYFSVSFTTRDPRPGEIHDKDYTFISRDEFLLMIDRGEFIEWAEVHGSLYGTSRKRIEENLKKGIDVLLDIDTQGASQIKKAYQGGVYIFIVPPTIQILKQRLEQRMTDSKEQVDERLKKAVVEIKRYPMYDYVIINYKVDVAFRQLEAIVISHKVSTRMINPEWIEERFK